MSPAGITKDHLLILRGNGVETLGILVNKMDDALWNRERFDEIRNQLIPYLKHLGFKKNQVQFIPLSGLEGVSMSISVLGMMDLRLSNF